ncbi:cobyrinate a,c-diamide synthase [Chitinasiproducens palmae]|uniref:Hydrogenobyrinic acid a,c-diamide synthase (Glutamine-hydrolysing) /cobyrinate a,c-diamide synthase n=1 Tax=Chitinasiproducens palmae TaxID=1770053 RepID=A0A1H2PSV5_9BURK|nr:cobyrinate a,c-diamide synthase [Chitinasiproducens palmae]SDV49700.1 hydrogenobyrinic acid a,c-diamide synthase (glutamine-hydrolysing) /cobyrinate a,c-diamide synthase [Chitinasiproducens palmae]
MPACPALFIAAPASGQGKTTVTAALARHHARLGRRVRVFKTGPDFLDPMILERASGAPVYTLHLTMVGRDACQRLLADAAAQADLILIEGVMGLFDGTPSSADLAAAFGVPVLAVIAAHGMAQTFGALAFGLANFRPGLPFFGVLANRVASERHGVMLAEAAALAPHAPAWLGGLPARADIALPSRHLGLVHAGEVDDLDLRLDRAADALADTALQALPPAVAFDAARSAPVPRWLAGRTIAVARDAAFCFVYPANLDLLRAMGAALRFFAPLDDEPIPADADALYLPGGYPELHAERLAGARRTADAVRAHAGAGRPIVAECGGMLYLLDRLGVMNQQAREAALPRTTDDARAEPLAFHAMLGVLPGEARMQARLSRLAMQVLDTAHGPLMGHTFHYSSMQTAMAPVAQARHATTAAAGEAVYRAGNTVATYMHAYWPSNPRATAAMFVGEPF